MIWGSEKKINGTDRAWWSRRKRGRRRSTCRCSGQGRGLCWVSSAASSFCPSNLPAILAPLAHLPLFFFYFFILSLTFLSLGGVVVGKDGLKERVPPKWKEKGREGSGFCQSMAEWWGDPFFFLLLSDHSNGLGQLGLLIFVTLFVPSPTLFSVFRNPMIELKLQIQWRNAIYMHFSILKKKKKQFWSFRTFFYKCGCLDIFEYLIIALGL